MPIRRIVVSPLSFSPDVHARIRTRPPAEPAYRRRGIAHTALQLLLSYATDPAAPAPLPVPKEKLVARIGDKNEPSIRLFEKLGFAVTKRVPVFEEVELRYVGANATPWISGAVNTLVLEEGAK